MSAFETPVARRRDLRLPALAVTFVVALAALLGGVQTGTSLAIFGSDRSVDGNAFTTGAWATPTPTPSPSPSQSPRFEAIGPAATRTSSGSVTVVYPSGTQTGDLLLLVQANAADQAITTPGDWQLLADQRARSPQQFRFTIWWRTAGSESSVLVSVNTNSSGTTLWVARFAAVAGAPAIVPAHAIVQQGTSPDGLTLTPSPDVTTTAPSTVVSIVASRAATSLSLAAPRDFQLGGTATQNLGGVGRTIGIAESVVTSASTPASPTWAQNVEAQWAWATVAFR
jgi:hypothetical protein